MYELVKGNMVMRNVTKEDKDMYVKAGWKLADNKAKKKTKVETKVEVIEDNSNDESIEE